MLQNTVFTLFVIYRHFELLFKRVQNTIFGRGKGLTEGIKK